MILGAVPAFLSASPSRGSARREEAPYPPIGLVLPTTLTALIVAAVLVWSALLPADSASAAPARTPQESSRITDPALLESSRRAGPASQSSRQPNRKNTGPEIRVLEETPRTLVYEIEVDWPRPLPSWSSDDADASLRPGSSGSSGVGSGAIDRALRSVGGVRDVSRIVELGREEVPGVEVLAREFESRDLSHLPDSARSRLAEAFGSDPAGVEAIGLMRRRPVGTFRARLLTYDPDREELRRYRYLRVRVRRTPPDTRTVRSDRSAAGKTGAITQSVLAEGRWFRVPVRREGVFRIDAAYLRDSLGLNPGSIDPASIGVYGNGGRRLPAANDAPRPRDLLPHAAMAVGGGDGSFDEGDGVYFYGAAPRGWDSHDSDRSGAPAWSHYRNPFSSENAYFIRVDDPSAPRVGEGGSAVSAGPAIDRQRARRFNEIDEVNLGADGGSGLDWLGRPFPQGQERLALEVAERPFALAGPVRVRTRFAVQSDRASRVEVLLGEELGVSADVQRTFNTQIGLVARPATRRFAQNVPADSPLRVRVRLAESGAGGNAYLDYAALTYPQRLEAGGGTLRFHAPVDTSGTLRFALDGFSERPRVWDVTHPGGVRALPVAGSGPYRTEVDQGGGRPLELVAFEPDGSSVRRPAAGREIPNQNLHGIQGHPEAIIVTPAAFRPAAEDLASFRRGQGLDVRVVEVEKIYNEFSGGVPDMRAVRDYLKFLYDRAGTEAEMPRYALLFGDGHVDYRGLTDPALSNWVLPYETRESLRQIATYTSDDYFGLLDDDEGTWDWEGSASVSAERVDLGIGRLPVQSLEQARAVVAKLKRYERAETLGGWRTRYIMVADDGPNGTADDRDLHTQNMEAVAPIIDREAGGLEQVKIYGQSYQAETTADGRRNPDARRAMLSGLERGALVWNYTGHGSWRALAAERLMTIEDVPGLANEGRPTIGVTATCSWGHWDMPSRQSGAEEMVLRARGGAIAMLTTVRIVFTSASKESYNVGLNRALNDMMLERGPDGQPRRLGEVMRLTKNTRAGAQGNNRKFNLIGDPMTRVGLPRREVRLSRINGVAIEDTTARLPALGRVSLEGEVRRRGGGRLSGFDGEATISVFDAERRVSLPPEKVTFLEDSSYTVQNDLIHRGRVRVDEGRFEGTFVVPKDISYSNDPGRIEVYARSSVEDGMGSTRRVRVGGTAENPVRDTSGPEIDLFIDDTTFVSGGLTGREPELIVQLADSTGLNVVGTGVGHQTTLVLDGREDQAVEIGRFFEGELGSSTEGSIRYPLPVQEEGPHTLEVTAWDVANNATTAELSYFVAPSRELTLENVYNYPNPTSGPTRFIFEHNQPPGTAATVDVRVYTLAGRPVRTIERSVTLSSGPAQIRWDGRDEDLDPLPTGVYLYRVRVRVNRPSGEREVAERIEKVAIVR